jgi:hypothetical protein
VIDHRLARRDHAQHAGHLHAAVETDETAALPVEAQGCQYLDEIGQVTVFLGAGAVLQMQMRMTALLGLFQRWALPTALTLVVAAFAFAHSR